MRKRKFIFFSTPIHDLNRLTGTTGSCDRYFEIKYTGIQILLSLVGIVRNARILKHHSINLNSNTTATQPAESAVSVFITDTITQRRGLLRMGISVFLFGFVFLISFSATAQALPAESPDWETGQIMLDEHQWVEVRVGDIPLVISVPHGGDLHDPSIPDRNCKELGSMVTVRDSRTIETAMAIEKAFLEKFNKRPYLIIAHLSRRKVDQNREMELATCGDPRGAEAWKIFHNYIDSALAHAQLTSEEVIYIDLHGHGHKNQRLELGYGLDAAQLRAAYTKQHFETLVQGSSLQNVLQHQKPEVSWEQIFGKHAFGTLIYAQGIPATPSLQDPHPLEGEKFFSGGYNTRRYTAKEYPDVYGWQIEANYKGVRDTPENRQRFAEAFLKAYRAYIRNDAP